MGMILFLEWSMLICVVEYYGVCCSVIWCVFVT